MLVYYHEYLQRLRGLGEVVMARVYLTAETLPSNGIPLNATRGWLMRTGCMHRSHHRVNTSYLL